MKDKSSTRKIRAWLALLGYLSALISGGWVLVWLAPYAVSGPRSDWPFPNVDPYGAFLVFGAFFLSSFTYLLGGILFSIDRIITLQKENQSSQDKKDENSS